MGIYVSPGVYTRERDISNIIPNVATTSAALVGYSAKGNTSDLVLITTPQQLIEEYGEPTPGYYFHYSALAFLEKGNVLYCYRVHKNALYGGVKIMEDGQGPNESLSVGSSVSTFQEVSGENILFYIFGKDQGTWNNSLSVKVEEVSATDYTFKITVYEEDEDGNDIEVEAWTVSRQSQLDGYGKQLYLETMINGYSKYIVVADNTSVADTVMPEEQTTALSLAGGSNGSAVTDSEVVTGWDKFTNPDVVDVRILINGGYASVAVQQKMKTICESRLDCMAILDMPYSELTSTTSMTTWRETTQNFNTSYTALYSPWVKIYDVYSDSVIDVPPSGYVAAQYAYNDYVGEVHMAPAGFNRGQLNVLGMSNDPFSQGERNVLYEAQINPLQNFRGEGNVIWGQKTQQVKASALDRVNVRRLLIFIEKAVSSALRYYCFEPNSVLTRYKVVAALEEFMDLLAAKGSFQTEAGDKGYRILCDATNNTPAIIDRNELHVDIFIKPSRAAEYIQLQAIITRTGASFEELIARGVQF